MSKSWGNAIWLEDEPSDMYAKVMAIRDDLIVRYYTLATDSPMEEVFAIEKELAGDGNPMEIKKKLAERIVTELHSPDHAKSSSENFQRNVQDREVPAEVTTLKLSVSDGIYVKENLLVNHGTATSRTEAKQLFAQGGVSIDGTKIMDSKDSPEIKSGNILRIGKRKIFKLELPE
jgi:tyrosyl-tRNA synthetase